MLADNPNNTSRQGTYMVTLQTSGSVPNSQLNCGLSGKLKLTLNVFAFAAADRGPLSARASSIVGVVVTFGIGFILRLWPQSKVLQECLGDTSRWRSTP